MIYEEVCAFRALLAVIHVEAKFCHEREDKILTMHLIVNTNKFCKLSKGQIFREAITGNLFKT